MLLSAVLQAVAGCCLLLLSAGIFKALSFVFKCRAVRRQYETSPIPGPPVSSHVLGHVPSIMGPKGPWTLVKWTKAFGPLFKIQFADYFGVVLTDPESIARVTRKTSSGPLLPKPRALYEPFDKSYSPSVPNIFSSADDAYWKAVRQAAAPCFSMSNLKQITPLVLELTQRVAERMSRHDSFDMTTAAKRITSDVMGHLLYGEDLRGTHWEPSEYFEALYGTIKAQAGMMNSPIYKWQLWDPEVRYTRRCMARHNELIREKVERLRAAPPAAHTIAAHLLSAIDPATGQPLNDHQVKAEIATFMAAGFETTSHAITWCLTMLATHTEVQDQVFAELQEAGLAATGSSSGRDFAASDLNRLPLLSAVIKESLRLVPPTPFGAIRQVSSQQGIEVCGHLLPKGTIVMFAMLPYGLAQHTYGLNALLFQPQRWMTPADANTAAAAGAAGAPDTEINRIHQTTPATAAVEGGGVALSNAPVAVSKTAEAAAPPDPNSFMSGSRDCIGQNLAKLELQVVLATLLSRFRFSPGPELEKELQLAAATGQPVVTALHALAGAFVTMQPLSGEMVLRISSRA